LQEEPCRQPSGPPLGPSQSPSSEANISRAHFASAESTHLRLLALLEECLLSRLLSGLVLGEVALFARLGQNLLVHTFDVHLCRRSNNISGVYPSQGNAVDFERAGDEENTLGKMLEKDDTLAAEAASKENDDGARRERLPGLCWTN